MKCTLVGYVTKIGWESEHYSDLRKHHISLMLAPYRPADGVLYDPKIVESLPIPEDFKPKLGSKIEITIEIIQ